MSESYELRHEPEKNRFVADFGDGAPAEVNYHRTDTALDLQRTYVPTDRRHAGVGAVVVKYALDYAREKGLDVIPTCPFVPWVIDNNPEYRDLVRSG